VKALIITDDQRLVKDASFYLLMGYPDCAVIQAKNSSDGLSLIETETPDLTIVSSALKDADIFSFTGQIRQFSDVPLLVLIEGTNEIDRAMVLEAGADDYIVNRLTPSS
jgi:DNA-binding response OmpR family regulator